MLMLSRLWASLLLAALMACATAQDAAPPTATTTDAHPTSPDTTVSPYPTPTVMPIGSPSGLLLTVTFRSPAGVPVSDQHPLRLQIGAEAVTAALADPPARREEAQAVVDQAVYRLPAEEGTRLRRTRPDAVTVQVHDGTRYYTYPYRPGDLVE